VIPFIDGGSGPRWIKCFRKRHPELVVRKAQALKQKQAKYLCLELVRSFYNNLNMLYDNEPHYIGIVMRVVPKLRRTMEIT